MKVLEPVEVREELIRTAGNIIANYSAHFPEDVCGVHFLPWAAQRLALIL